ncbi:FAD-dependent oxidoreductase [Ideonella sp. YS5]|uniref:FAD-dependent oxidoreductase n=1 Tax=Ideonella sp. YS5 TaxID=3453714 RepID=UPI003EEFFBD1
MTNTSIKRRELLLAAAGTLGMAAWPGANAARPRKHVIVIGGGMAGATLAKYLRLWGDRIAVTLIERVPRYTSCIMSSLVLTGQRQIADLRYSYSRLKQVYGVNVVIDDVLAVDPATLSVRLASGTVLGADRIVLAPGIAFDPVPGLTDPNAMPHAWKAGPQTTLLRQQLQSMASNAVAVLTIPKVPYRCPPGPYERACLLADWLKVNKPQAKLLVLDANPDFVTEKDNFSQAFFGLHADVIEYRTQTEVLSADAATMTLQTTTGNVHGDVINLIPRQRCAPIVSETGLANATEGRFAAVDVLSYESTAAAGIHVIGDSSATTQPKAGHIANQEAKVCADAIVRSFGGYAADPAPVTNSACFSTITMKEASWLEAVFQYDPSTRVMVPVANATGASVGWSRDNFDQMQTWFRALMADTFA